MSSSRKADAGAGRSLAAAAGALADLLDAEPGERERSACARLRASVVRPLRERRGLHTDAPGGTPAAGVADELWQLALTATKTRVTEPDDAHLAEAAAALQSLALAFAESAAADRLAQLERLQAPLAA